MYPQGGSERPNQRAKERNASNGAQPPEARDGLLRPLALRPALCHEMGIVSWQNVRAISFSACSFVRRRRFQKPGRAWCDIDFQSGR